MRFQTRRFLWSRPTIAGQSGFGLVELMVSLAIGLVIIAAMVALFMGTSRNNREMATANSVIENGRFAIELLENDVVHGGYWGTYVPDFDNQLFSDGFPDNDAPIAIPDPCIAYPSANWNDAYVDEVIGIPVQTFNAVTIVSDTTCDTTGAVGMANLQSGSDLLVVRHAELCVSGDVDCVDTPGLLNFQSSLCTECAEAAFVLDTTHAVPATDAARFSLHLRDGVTRASKRKFMSSLYYIRDFAETAGDGIPTLVRSDFMLTGTLRHQAAVPLIEGIQAMRVELGIDNESVTNDPVNYAVPVDWEDPDDHTTATNRGDGEPDGDYIRCTNALPLCTAGDLTNVTSVRIHVLARSREPTRGYTDTKTYDLGGTAFGPFNDEFKRHVYTTTIRLPNVAGRRERP